MILNPFEGGNYGIDSETVWIGNKPIRGCIACNRCGNQPGACVFNDDICNEISAKYASADALVFGSQYWNIVYGREPVQAALDQEGRFCY